MKRGTVLPKDFREHLEEKSLFRLLPAEFDRSVSLRNRLPRGGNVVVLPFME